MIEVGREQALRHGVKNVEYRLGDMEEIPIEDAKSIWSSSRNRSITPCTPSAPCMRHGGSSSPGGRIVILDLIKHRFEEARELYADEWLGFSETELEAMLDKAGFRNMQTSVVHKEPETP
jgi:hypothetical protein